MMLDGVAPPGMIITLDVWRTREAALDAIFKACAAIARAAARRIRTSRRRCATIERSARDRSGREVDVVDPRTGARRVARA